MIPENSTLILASEKLFQKIKALDEKKLLHVYLDELSTELANLSEFPGTFSQNILTHLRRASTQQFVAFISFFLQLRETEGALGIIEDTLVSSISNIIELWVQGKKLFTYLGDIKNIANFSSNQKEYLEKVEKVVKYSACSSRRLNKTGQMLQITLQYYDIISTMKYCFDEFQEFLKQCSMDQMKSVLSLLFIAENDYKLHSVFIEKCVLHYEMSSVINILSKASEDMDNFLHLHLPKEIYCAFYSRENVAKTLYKIIFVKQKFTTGSFVTEKKRERLFRQDKEFANNGGKVAMLKYIEAIKLPALKVYIYNLMQTNKHDAMSVSCFSYTGSLHDFMRIKQGFFSHTSSLEKAEMNEIKASRACLENFNNTFSEQCCPSVLAVLPTAQLNNVGVITSVSSTFINELNNSASSSPGSDSGCEMISLNNG